MDCLSSSSPPPVSAQKAFQQGGIHFDLFLNWRLEATDPLLARQYDNNSRTITVTGNLPEGWTWEMLACTSGTLDVIPLTPTEDGASAVLSGSQLAHSGFCALQLRGHCGDQIRHTNIIHLLVGESLTSPDQEVST